MLFYIFIQDIQHSKYLLFPECVEICWRAWVRAQVSAHPLSRYVTADAPFEATAVKGFDWQDESLWIPECCSFSCYRNEVNPLVPTALECWGPGRHDLTLAEGHFHLSGLTFGSHVCVCRVWRLILWIHCCSTTGLAISATTVTGRRIPFVETLSFSHLSCFWRHAVSSQALPASPEIWSRTSALSSPSPDSWLL